MPAGMSSPGSHQLPALLLAVLLLSAVGSSTAAFTETFTESSTAQSLTAPDTVPFLWAVKGDVTSPGRGPVDPKATPRVISSSDNKMMLGSTFGGAKAKAAETVLLNWDGTNTTLQFFVHVRDTGASTSFCPSTAPRVLVSWSADRRTWQPLWNSSGSWVDTNPWIGVRVPLPLSAAAPQFAVKWVNTDPGAELSQSPCTVVYIDDISFPAQPPTAQNMGLGKPPGQLPAESEECKTCSSVYELLLGQQAVNKAISDAAGRFGLSPRRRI